MELAAERGESELVLPVLTRASLSTLDDEVIPLSPTLPHGHWQFQELLQRVTYDLEILLEAIHDPQH